MASQPSTASDAVLDIEQGPIRPPSEARSLFLRLTRNCPWNRCLFCPVYKKRKFSLRTVEEIKADIDTAAQMIEAVKELSWSLGSGGRVDDGVISHVFHSPNYSDSLRNVAAWLYFGQGSVFLQDANNMIMKPDDLVAVLNHLRATIPGISRVTTYARSKSVKQKSLEALKRIRRAGLDRIHIGLETGHDPLLKFMKKGVSAAEQIEAGQKAVAAGFELSEYVMPGLGGREMSRGHALDTALALNQINPHFIRLRTLRVPERVPLYEEMVAGNFTMLDDEECLAEIRLFLENLEGITSRLTSDHIMNLIETLNGKLPEDKERLLGIIDDYFALPEEERLLYRVGRRAGLFRGPADLGSAGRSKAEAILSHIRGSRPGSEEAVIKDMADRFV
ncbi:MAG: radical SAM protein [Deltaproteobacteria bacterium]|nr:radical SAM protein [Deltaproteobacteria bacterium]